jgi:transcriptional regulator with XRE-family HTH domain
MPASKSATPGRPRSSRPAAPAPASEIPLLSLAKQVRGWADALLSVAGNATDIGLTLAKSGIKSPGQKAAVAKAGHQLRKWREATGLTARELAEAVGLGDAKLIEDAEVGLAALPFDVVLRLAGVLGRHDPIPVAMALTRQYNPQLWRALEGIGIGHIAVQGTREREMANVYRGNDQARKLDDAQFAQVLAFTRQAFEMAVDLYRQPAASAQAASANAASAPSADAGDGETTPAKPRSARPRPRPRS